MTIKRVETDELFNRVNGLDKFFREVGLQQILDTGCFIAGGFVRKIWRDKTTTNLGEFFGAGSDIDVFAPDAASFQRCYLLLSTMSSYDGTSVEPRRSPYSNAWTFYRTFKFDEKTMKMICSDDDDARYNCAIRTIRIQLVDCILGNPYLVLSSFDIINCMFALSNDGFYFDENAIIFEDKKILSCSRSTDILGSRIAKYYRRHDYKSLDEKTVDILKDWVLTNETNLWQEQKSARKIFAGRNVAYALLRHLPVSIIMMYVGHFKTSAIIKTCDVSYDNLNNGMRAFITIDGAIHEIMEKNEIKPCDVIEFIDDAKDIVKCHCAMVLGVINERTKTKERMIRVTTGTAVFEIGTGIIKRILQHDEANKFFQ